MNSSLKNDFTHPHVVPKPTFLKENFPYHAMNLKKQKTAKHAFAFQQRFLSRQTLFTAKIQVHNP